MGGRVKSADPPDSFFRSPLIPDFSRLHATSLLYYLEQPPARPSSLLTNPTRSAPAVRSAGLALATRRWERAPARAFPHRTAKCQEPETFLPFESAGPR